MNKIRKLAARLTSLTSSAVMAVSSLGLSSAPNMTVDAADGGDDYAKLLQYSLYFYDANYCGPDAGERSRLTWRGDCHTSDGVPGGFHDAGDHVKFGLPAGYTASDLGWSYYEFSDAYNETGQANHLREITDHFAEFFRASTTLNGDTVTNFVYQVGDGKADHEYWRAPEVDNDMSTRTVLSTSSGASDIAAEYAAALALNYINFKNEDDLKYAKALYDYSVKTNTITGAPGFYESTSLADDQAWAAGWLYLATNDSYYKDQCTSKRPEVYWFNSWDNNALAANCVYGYVTGDWSKADNFLKGQCRSSDYLFADAWGSARYNAQIQFCALAVSRHTSSDYKAWAKGQMDYLLGNKGVGSAAPTCFVVGFADNSAKYPHHRAASGFGSSDEFNASDGSYSSSGHVLPGALVGGPTDGNGSYADTVQDYQANEVALDYNAGLVGAAAGLYAAYHTGAVVPVSEIPGVKTGVNDSEPIVTTPAVTTASGSGGTAVTTATTPVVVTPGVRKLTVNTEHSLNGGDQFERWYWFEFDLGENEYVNKVEVELEAVSGSIGQWQGAFAVSTYSSDWVQTDSISGNFGSSGTVTWEIPEETSRNIKYDSSMLNFGTWWSESQSFKVKSVTLYTTAEAEVTTTAPPTTKPVTTTTKPITTTTKPITTTTKPVTTTTKPVTTTTKPITTTTKPVTTTTKPITTTTKPITTTTKPVTTTTKPVTTTTKPVTTTTKPITTTTKPVTTTTEPVTTTTKPVTTTTEPVTTTTSAPEIVKGDVNGDGYVSVADIVAMSRYLLGHGSADAKTADLDGSGRVDVFDLVLMRRLLISL